MRRSYCASNGRSKETVIDAPLCLFFAVAADATGDLAGGLPFVRSSKNSNGESNSAGDSNEEAKYLLYGWRPQSTEIERGETFHHSIVFVAHINILSRRGVLISELDSKID